jgi:hypothetical protein
MSVRLGNWKREYMAVMACYTDVGGSLSEIVLSPATLVSSPEKWQQFDRRWNDCLCAFEVSALHMKDFAHSRGEFSSWKFDEPRRRRFLNSLMWIIEETVEYSAAVSIYVGDYKRVDEKYRLSEWVRPYTLGCMSCAARIIPWAEEQQHNKNNLIWIFEKGDQDQNDLRKHWDIAYPDRFVDPIFLKKQDAYGSKESRRIRPFEAADFIGYENLLAHRLIVKKGGDQVFSDLRKPMQRLSKINGGDLWGYLREAEIVSLCSMSNIQLR